MYVGVCVCVGVCVYACKFQLNSPSGAAQQFHRLRSPICEATPVYLDVEKKLLVKATCRLSSFKVVHSLWAVNCIKSEQHSRDSDMCSASVTTFIFSEFSLLQRKNPRDSPNKNSRRFGRNSDWLPLEYNYTKLSLYRPARWLALKL
jgi:hypothetical protein